MIGAGAMTSIIFFGAAFLASLFGVALFTDWSVRRGLFDIPNDRSSHSTPTPRGGGLIVVLVCLAGYVLIGPVLGLPISSGYIAGAILVAAVSWIDDLYSLPFWSRLIFHILAACILTWDVGFWSQLPLPFTEAQIPLGSTVGLLVSVVWLVWLLNAYNFMDGIDGIAGIQAVVTGVAWTILAAFLDLPSTFLFAGIIACSSLGFLIHNWQPAKIFMGDVGSAFLGFTLAAMPLLARSEKGADDSRLLVAAVLFVWFFVFDTVFTLSRRLLARKRIWEPHREHVYQKLVIEGKSHSSVALLYGIGSALLSAAVLCAFIFSGIHEFLALFSLLFLTFLVAYSGIRKKR